jgi:hypothetical protein
MMKNKILGVGFVGAVLVMMAIGVFALDLQAHAAAPTVSTITTVHAYIITSKVGIVFKQTTITVARRTPFEFTNDTAVSQTVTSKGIKIVTVAAHSSSPYTFKATGTYIFSLSSNTKAKLTVTVK